jgi:hypothetical protein
MLWILDAPTPCAMSALFLERGPVTALQERTLKVDSVAIAPHSRDAITEKSCEAIRTEIKPQEGESDPVELPKIDRTT